MLLFIYFFTVKISIQQGNEELSQISHVLWKERREEIRKDSVIIQKQSYIQIPRDFKLNVILDISHDLINTAHKS